MGGFFYSINDITFNNPNKNKLMKKLFTLIAVFVLVSATFVSCEKDDDESASNTITITGTFEVGDKTYTNPTFDLGSPENNNAWVRNDLSVIRAFLKDEIMVIGGGYSLYYVLRIYDEQLGMGEGEIDFAISSADQSSIYFTSNEFSVNVTSIGEVGGYIEGTYEGVLYPPTAKNADGFPVKGKFKVKRVPEPEPVK